MAPGTHTGANGLDFSFGDRFPIMSYPPTDEDPAYGDDLPHSLAVDVTCKEAGTTYEGDHAEDDDYYYYYYHHSPLEPSRADYSCGTPPTSKHRSTQQRYYQGKPSAHLCQQQLQQGRCRTSLDDGRGQPDQSRLKYVVSIDGVEPDDAPSGRLRVYIDHRKQLRAAEGNQRRGEPMPAMAADTEEYIHRCPFAHCTHHHQSAPPTDAGDRLQQRGQHLITTNRSSASCDDLSSRQCNINISNPESSRLSGELRTSTETGTDHYPSSSLPARSIMSPPFTPSPRPIDSLQKSLPNYNSSIYKDKYAAGHRSLGTTLRQGLSKCEASAQETQLRATVISESLSSAALLEAISNGAAACDGQDSCQEHTVAAACGGPVYCDHHHRNTCKSGRVSEERTDHPLSQSITSSAAEVDLQGYVRREFINVFSRPPLLMDTKSKRAASVSTGLLLTSDREAARQQQTTYLQGRLVPETEQVIDVKKNISTASGGSPSTLKQQVTPGLRRRAVEYIVQQLGGGCIKRTCPNKAISPTTTQDTSINIHSEGLLSTALNSTSNNDFTSATLRSIASASPISLRTTRSNQFISEAASSPVPNSTQPNALHSTEASTRGSTTTTISNTNEEVSKITTSNLPPAPSSDSPELKRLYRTVERLEEMVYATANAKKEDYMKTLASKLAIIFNELQQHNSLYLQQPTIPASSSSISTYIQQTVPSLPSTATTLPNTRPNPLQPPQGRQTSDCGEIVGQITSRMKSSSEEELGKPKYDVGNSKFTTKPQQARPSSCQI